MRATIPLIWYNVIYCCLLVVDLMDICEREKRVRTRVSETDSVFRLALIHKPTGSSLLQTQFPTDIF